MSRRRTLLVAGAGLAAVALVVGGAAVAASRPRAQQAPDGGAGVARHVVPPAEVERAREYWTEERMRGARPAPMPDAGAGGPSR